MFNDENATIIKRDDLQCIVKLLLSKPLKLREKKREESAIARGNE